MTSQVNDKIWVKGDLARLRNSQEIVGVEKVVGKDVEVFNHARGRVETVVLEALVPVEGGQSTSPLYGAFNWAKGVSHG